MKNKIVISSILLGLMVLFLCMKSVWAGFVYFAISSLSLFCLYWAVMLSIGYHIDYKVNFQEDFALYKAQVINSCNMDEMEFEKNRAFHIKKFKRTLQRDKAIDIFKILFCISMVITCVLAMSMGYVR